MSEARWIEVRRVRVSARRLGSGFTLVELLVTVAIVGILASIAIPSYQASVARGQRAEAKAALLENAQFLERNFTESNAYDTDSAGNAIAIPITVAPREGTATYTLAATTLTASAFVLAATPIAGERMADDTCGVFVLNNFGQKAVDGDQDGTPDDALQDTCWNR